MIRLIAMDLDGTLLDDTKRIPAVNRQAIDEARKKGVQIVLCSGRSGKSMDRYVKELDLDHPGEYWIASNGACIYEGDRKEPWNVCYLPDGAVSALVYLGREYGEYVNPHLYVGDQFLVERYLPCTQRYERLSGSQCTCVPSLDPYIHTPMYKMLYNNLGELDQLIWVQKQIENRLPQDVQMFRSSDYLLEFVHKDAGKWNAVLKLASFLSIQKNEILCIGDHENDKEMVQNAYLGATPSNGISMLREAADYVSELDNNQGAVADIFHFAKNQGIF